MSAVTDHVTKLDLLGDKRVIAGWLLAPLAAIGFWKSMAILVVPATYVAMLFVGMPALQYCYRRGWLQWWHALVVGWLAGAVIGAVYAATTDPYHVEISGPGTAVILQLYGVVVGVLFWFLAVFKNRNFPQRGTNWALLSISLFSVVFLLWTALARLEVSEVFGVATRYLPSGDVVLRLSDGSEVEARDDREPSQRISLGREVKAYTRLGLISGTRLYWTAGVCRDDGSRTARC